MHKPAIRKPLPPHLPRETVMHEPQIICVCGDCDRSRLTCLGEDVTEVREKIPAWLKVIRHVRPRYACRKCEAVFQPPAPDLPIERGRPGPGLIANVLVSKFCDGLPLYRQSVILAREGIEIDRATLADWLGRAAWWLATLAMLIGQYVMGLPVIHTDDTTIKIAKLYEIEAEIVGKSADIRLATRRDRGQPLLDIFHVWAKEQRRRISGKTALGRAFNYALARWEALSCFALDGRLSIDNNLSERLLRGVAAPIVLKSSGTLRKTFFF